MRKGGKQTKATRAFWKMPLEVQQLIPKNLHSGGKHETFEEQCKYMKEVSVEEKQKAYSEMEKY